jgi:hypothetical protein
LPSTVAGYLAPNSSPAPLEGKALLIFLQAWIVGICGLPANMVRPRWQVESVNIPPENTDWAAFGITKKTTDTFAAELHYPTGNGYNEIRRHEIMNIVLSFYGPNADNYVSILREGMQVAQNREVLSLNNMGLVDSGDVVTAPELVKDKWYYRVDFDFRIRRQIVRDYSIENLLASEIDINNEIYTEIVLVN